MGRHGTIAGRKAAQDSKRAAVFTKYARLITVAAREGGGDPDYNPNLRTIVEKAKGLGMPNDNVKRAIMKGTGELGGETYESGRFEGYGAGGVAVIVEVLTDNKNRTSASMSHAFDEVAAAFKEAGYEPVESDVMQVPNITSTPTDEAAIKNLKKMVALLEDDDDVQHVYTNCTIDLYDEE